MIVYVHFLFSWRGSTGRLTWTCTLQNLMMHPQFAQSSCLYMLTKESTCSFSFHGGVHQAGYVQYRTRWYMCESYDPPVYMFTAENIKNTPFEPPTFSHITNSSFFNASMSFCFAPNWLFSAVYIHFCEKAPSNTEQRLAEVTEVDNTMFTVHYSLYTQRRHDIKIMSAGN